jgi:NADPH2:quinone reductase
MAVGLARRAGAVVVATASGEEKKDLVQKLGAHLVVDYRSEQFDEVLKTDEVRSMLEKWRKEARDGDVELRNPFAPGKDELVFHDGSGDGVDVILDMIGGEYIRKNVQVLGTEGRMVSIAFRRGSAPPNQFDFMRIMLKRLTLTGSTLRSRSDDAKAAIVADMNRHGVPSLCLLPSDDVRPPVVRNVYSLEDVDLAHAELERGKAFAKTVLRVV